MNNNTDSNWEKKSERFEVRLPYSKKQAFLQACEDQGDTPSSAVRRFIDGYLRRADMDVLKAAGRAIRNMALRNWLPIGVLSAVCIGAAFLGRVMMIENTKTKIAHKKVTLFSSYDANHNGVLDIGEISKTDAALHRVLNIDGEAGISLKEFRIKGKMRWGFVKVNSNGDTGVTFQSDRLVLFDLSKQKTAQLNSWKYQKTDTVSSDSFDRYVMWKPEKSKPQIIMEDVEIGVNDEGKHTILMQNMTVINKTLVDEDGDNKHLDK